MLQIKVKRFVHSKGLDLPRQMTFGSAGADLTAAVENPVTLSPGSFALIPTGLAVEVPEGYEMQVRPRSGLAAKHGVTVLNTPGTVDADYRGEVKVILANHISAPSVHGQQFRAGAFTHPRKFGRFHRALSLQTAKMSLESGRLVNRARLMNTV